MNKKRFDKTFTICFGGLFISLFAIAANVPGLSSIALIPGVPITLQIFFVAVMALILGTKGGMLTLSALFLLTACGLPLMSGGKGGLVFFIGPTSGYVFGWIFLILILGLYRDKVMGKLLKKKAGGIVLHLPVSFFLGILGVILDYACGVAGIILTGGNHTEAFLPMFFSNFVFLPADTVKILGASFLSMALCRSRLFKWQESVLSR